MTTDETNNGNSCNNSREPSLSCEDKSHEDNGTPKHSKVDNNLLSSPWTDAFLHSSSDGKSTQEQSDKIMDSAQTFTEKRQRSPGELVIDARFMLRFALYDNHLAIKMLIQQGLIQLVSKNHLKSLREGTAHGLPVTYLTKKGWQQELELAGMIEDEIRRRPPSPDQQRAITKSLPAVRRWSLAHDLG